MTGGWSRLPAHLPARQRGCHQPVPSRQGDLGPLARDLGRARRRRQRLRIWATHFIAMLAYAPGAGAGYNVGITLLSLVFAVGVTAVGLSIALSGLHKWAVPAGGAVVGTGVAAMHYTGMMAFEIPAHIVWSPGIVLASILFGSVFAALALVVANRREKLADTIAAIVLLTVAIVSHHFPGWAPSRWSGIRDWLAIESPSRHRCCRF